MSTDPTGQDAVADVVGSTLLVGITVLSAVAFGALLFAFEGPDERLWADLEMRVDPGTAGWGTGDERLEVVHLGGQPVPMQGTRIRWAAGASVEARADAALGSAFSDGWLTISEVWHGPPMTIAQDTLVDVAVIAGDGQSRIVSSGRVSPAGHAPGLGCALDVTPPSVAFVQTPQDLTTASGPVTVQATLSDACAGVDGSVTPRLSYRVTPTASFIDAGPMGQIGPDQWSASIAAPGGSWALHAGQVLHYHLAPVTDLKGNTGQSGTRSDLVDAAFIHTYVGPFTVTRGSVEDPGSARSATDGGAEAALDEGTRTTAPGTGSGAFSGSAATAVGPSNPTAALTSDDVRVVLDATGEHVQVSGFDLPPSATGVSAITVAFEGRKNQGGGTNPTGVLSYNFGAGSGPTTQTVQVSQTTDTTFTQVVTADRLWTVQDVESMRVRVAASSIGNRNLEVDHISITVVYLTGGTTYTMEIRADWSDVPPGASHQVQLGYRTAVESFQVQAFNGATWRTCPGTLASATPATFTCDLAGDEHLAGSPRIRFVDVDPAGTSEGSIFLDYARVGTL